jgi:hypothetical protein
MKATLWLAITNLIIRVFAMNKEKPLSEEGNEEQEFTKKEIFMMIIAGYRGMLPAILGIAITFILVLLLVHFWTGGG